MNKTDYAIKDLKGIPGYQFLQVMYYLMRTAYYTNETNPKALKIESFFEYVGKLEGNELESFLTKVATICGDIPVKYWDIILRNVTYKGDNIIPESISTIPVDVLVYIVREGIKKVLAIQLPF